QKKNHGETAENSLRDHRADGTPSENARAAFRIAKLEKNRLQHREKSDGSGDHAMTVLVEDSADHRRHQPAIRQRPIRDGEAGTGRRDHRAGEDEKESRRCDELREIAEPERGHSRETLYLKCAPVLRRAALRPVWPVKRPA